MALSVEALALAKKYVDESLVGVGALKGSPCTIKSTTDVTGGTKITFAWTDTDDVEHTKDVTVLNGAKGDDGDDYVITSEDYTAIAEEVLSSEELQLMIADVKDYVDEKIGGALSGSY